ncbi:MULTISPECIES: HEPN domain-containing protein [unclassified Pseudomonas]|uniref:HEPN domain-containing protein n=1 Tax=unclassified Pseudomonas TaxID=196821 RepID=UPI00215B9513|nr:MULTISPECIES: HEPN domain-containing protein [unclassified Pseudomonas]MCR8930421.1 HEPN domain-containing protein [Pseudomonas sp. S11A4]MCR8974023.1 HEPN domain-containing protein [Pseudomonas sp. S11P7]
MTSFLIVKILDDRSIMLPSTLNYGRVELRSYSADTQLESIAFEKSASDNGLDFNKHKVCARIATIIECETHSEAIHSADTAFLEVLDFTSTEFSISAIKTSRIGLIKDLASGEITPITRSGFHQSMSFVMRQGTIQNIDTTVYLLSLKNELCDRYRRSLHWARNSKNETNPQLKIIFLWFALEALLKADEADNCVESYIRLFLGFPNGQQQWIVSPITKAKLENHARYKYWQKELIDTVKEIRDFRNNSVHSGFRSVDFSKEKLELFSSIMIFAVGRCQAGVMQGLLGNLETLSDFKEYAVPIFENNTNLINDIHNNVIYSLDHPMLY